MKVTVVILNWNGKELLERFIPGIISKSGNGARIVVADNDSTDDSIPFIQQNFPSVNIIKLDKNLGYAGGYNKALMEMDSDIFVLLNSDVEVTENWITPVVDHMKQNNDVAICQPKLLWYHERDKFEYAGASGGFIDKLGYPFCRGRMFNTLEVDKGQYNNVQDIFWASGACMFIRSKVFKELGGFDDTFFAHMEEIDLCWRAQLKGHKVAVVPSSVVYHMGGATLNKINPRKTYLNFRNNLSMLYKNLPAGRLLPVIFSRLILDGIAGIKFIAEGDIKDCLAVIKAHFHFYGRIFSGRLKRTKGISALPDTVYRKCVLWEYFAKGSKKYSDLKMDDIK